MPTPADKIRSFYPPGCKVVRYLHPRDGQLEVIIHDREYYEGKGDHAGLRCERWGRESREWLEKFDDPTQVRGAYVPLPGSTPR